MSVDVFYKTNIFLDGPWTHLSNSRKKPLCGVEITTEDWELMTIGEIVDDALCPTCAKKRRRGHTYADPRGRFTTFVYIVNVIDTAFYKVGITTNLDERLSALQTGSALPLHLDWASDPCLPEEALRIERAMHGRFSAKRLTHPRQKEWFQLNQSDVVELKILIGSAVTEIRSGN